MPPDRQGSFADFLRTSVLSVLRSMPVGIWVDHDLRTRFPELQVVQEQAIRRQTDTHAALFRPEIKRSIPETPLRLSLAMNAAFARFWGTELNEPGWTLPYLAAGVLPQGDTLLVRPRDLPPTASNHRSLIQAWANSLGLGSWIRWIPYAA